MQGFNPNTRLAKIVCWVNVVMAIPYLASTFFIIIQSLTDPVFREYNGKPSVGTLAFIIFYCFFLYSLIRIRKWSRWLILIDAIGGFLHIFKFPIAGAYVLTAHPGQYVYKFLIDIGRGFSGPELLWIVFLGKSSINTFNIFYFFGDPIFRLANRYRLAHAIWLLPSIILVGMPAYTSFKMIEYTRKYISPVATKIAEEEFRKITCNQVRENNDKEISYIVDGHDVKVTYHYDYTGVWVKSPDGKRGSSGGPKYFCRPGYTGPMKEK